MLKSFIKKILTKLGYSLNRSSSFLTPSSEQTLKTLLNKDEDLCIFDVGAYTGNSAKNYSSWFKHSKIFSFEPFLETFKELNKLSSTQISPFNIGFSDFSKDENFCINKGPGTNSILPLVKNADLNWGGIEDLQPVGNATYSFSTIDLFMHKHEITCVDFLKIDVQGAEFKVLDGAKKHLESKTIKIIQIEIIIAETYEGQKSMSYYLNFFEGYGYSLKAIADLTFHRGQLLQLDMFFAAI